MADGAIKDRGEMSIHNMEEWNGKDFKLEPELHEEHEQFTRKRRKEGGGRKEGRRQEWRGSQFRKSEIADASLRSRRKKPRLLQ